MARWLKEGLSQEELNEAGFNTSELPQCIDFRGEDLMIGSAESDPEKDGYISQAEINRCYAKIFE